MTLPEDGPCGPWFTWEEVTRCTRVDLSGVDAPTQAQIIEEVTDLVWALTGRRFPGVCEVTRSICQPCSCHRDPCCCGLIEKVDLGSLFPVNDVIEVVIDGAAVDPTVWRVDGWRWLVRLDDDVWPRCVDLRDPEGFQVTWTYGRNPPSYLRTGAARYAAEVAASCIPGAACNLPQRVTSVVREGVTYVVLDSAKYLSEGRTGFLTLDLAIETANRAKRARPGMFIPGGKGTKRVATGTDAGGS